MENPEAITWPPVNAVIHAAAHFHLAGPRKPYFRINVDDRGSPVRNSAENSRAPSIRDNSRSSRAALTFSRNDLPLTPTMVRLIGREFTINDSAARRELGYIGKVSRTEGLAAYDDKTL